MRHTFRPACASDRICIPSDSRCHGEGIQSAGFHRRRTQTGMSATSSRLKGLAGWLIMAEEVPAVSGRKSECRGVSHFFCTFLYDLHDTGQKHVRSAQRTHRARIVRNAGENDGRGLFASDDRAVDQHPEEHGPFITRNRVLGLLERRPMRRAMSTSPRHVTFRNHAFQAHSGIHNDLRAWNDVRLVSTSGERQFSEPFKSIHEYGVRCLRCLCLATRFHSPLVLIFVVAEINGSYTTMTNPASRGAPSRFGSLHFLALAMATEFMPTASIEGLPL